MVMYCDTRTDVHCTHLHADSYIEKKYIYDNSHINCGNDKKNQRFYKINLVHITRIGITLNLL